MMNRPRPRKIVSVIKSSPSTESIEEKSPKSNYVDPQIVTEASKVSVKLQSPTVPTFSNSPTRQSIETKPEPNPVTFVPRKPVVATLKKANVPPPPTFSDSPKSSPISLTKSESSKTELPKSESPKSDISSPPEFNTFKNNTVAPKALSPKSSGEAFLDAADKAADFIGGALLNSFKSFNLTDTSTVKMTSPTSPKEQEQPEEDPFADIMNKLKSQQKPKPPAEYSNLMDEEPPETFKQLNEPSEVHRKPSPLKTKPSEPSSFIKAAFSPKPKDEKEEKEKFIEPLEPSEIATEIVVKSEAVSEITTHFAELEEELKDIEYEEILKIEEPEVIVKEETNFITQDSIVEDQKLSVMETETEVITQEPTNQNVFLDLQDTEIITNEPADEKVSVELQDSEIIAQEPIVEDQMVEDRLVPVVIQEYFSTPVEPLEFLKTQVEEKNHKSPKSPIFPSFESYENSQSIGFLQQPEVISSSTSTIPFFDSLSSIMGTSDNSSTSSIKSPSSPQTKSTGFRASILKHGLSALEKIGKSTADVVVSTRNKLAEPAMTQFIPSQQPITPDYSDEISTFYDILKLYGGYAKLQELQLKGVRASITMKLARRRTEKYIEKVTSFDYQSRLKMKKEISGILHPDRIMDIIDDSDPSNYLFLSENEFNLKFPNFGAFPDEVFCIQKLLKSLDNILIISGDDDLIASNRRRHVICQISTVFCTLLHQMITQSSLQVAKELSVFTSQLIKYLQTNFARNCEDGLPRIDRDQQLAIKLFLDISYSTVPLLQSFY